MFPLMKQARSAVVVLQGQGSVRVSMEMAE